MEQGILVKHIMNQIQRKGNSLVLRDLSYSNAYPFHDNTRWDTRGRFIERNAAYQPWISTAEIHELGFSPQLEETTPFKPYMHRYYVPYASSHSTSPLWYWVKRASAYIIVLSSYSAYEYSYFCLAQVIVSRLSSMVEPQPGFSAYREASFRHGIFDIKNRTHAYLTWHRNQDAFSVEADSFWFHNRYWNPFGKSFVASY